MKLQKWLRSRRSIAVLFLVIYLTIGMFVFYAIEASNEQANRRAVENLTVDLISPGFLQLLMKQDEPVINNLTGLNLVGITLDPNNNSRAIVFFTRIRLPQSYNSHKWNLPGSLLFVITLVTTIGYGDLAPSTAMGKMCCVIFAIFGIPLYAIILKQKRQMCVTFASWLEKRTRRVFDAVTSTIVRPRHLFVLTEMPSLPAPAAISSAPAIRSLKAAEKMRQKSNKYLSKWSLFVVGYILMLTVPSGIFTLMEGWDYLSALYYNFISLSTIGFGDMIAANNRYGTSVLYSSEVVFILYRIYVSVWIFVGLPFASTIMTIWRKLIERFLDLVAAVCCKNCCCKIQVDKKIEEEKAEEGKEEGTTQ